MESVTSIQACGSEFTLSNTLVSFRQISTIDKRNRKKRSRRENQRLVNQVWKSNWKGSRYYWSQRPDGHLGGELKRACVYGRFRRGKKQSVSVGQAGFTRWWQRQTEAPSVWKGLWMEKKKNTFGHLREEGNAGSLRELERFVNWMSSWVCKIPNQDFKWL